MPKKNKVLEVGDKAADLTLPDAESGREVSLDDLLGRPTVLVFLRGTW